MTSNDGRLWLAIIVLLTIAAGYVVYVLVAPHVAEEETHNENPLLKALEEFKGDAVYTVFKEEAVNNKTYSLMIARNNSSYYVRRVDNYYLLTTEYYHINNSSLGCVLFQGMRGCTDPSKKAFLYTLAGADDTSFVKGYLPIVEKLAEAGALHLEREWEREDGVNCFTYNYSFADLPIKEVMELHYPTAPEKLKVLYRSTLCLDDKHIYFFEKNYSYLGKSYHEYTKLVNLSENASIPDMPERSDEMFQAVYNAWDTFAEDLDKGMLTNNTDSALTGLAARHDLPELCFRTTDPDSCLKVYVSFSPSHANKVVCDMMENATLREQCYSYVENLTATPSNESDEG